MLRSDPLSRSCRSRSPGDWPRQRRDRARHAPAATVNRDSRGRWRDRARARARARPPFHHRIRPPAGIRVRDRHHLVPGVGEPPGDRGSRNALPERVHRLHPGLHVRPVAHRLGRSVAGRHRRPDQAPADPGRCGDRLPRLVDGPRARSAPVGGAARGPVLRPQPGQLVRQRRVGPGRLVRRRVPAARPARAVARPPGAGRDLHDARGGHQAAARHPRAARRHHHDPPGAVAGRRVRRRSAAGPDRAASGPPRAVPGLGARDRPSDPDPDHGPRRADHGGHPRGPVQPVGGGADPAGAIRALRAPRAGRAGGGRLPVRHRQRLQPLGARPRRQRPDARPRRAVDVRHDGHRSEHSAAATAAAPAPRSSARCRRSPWGARCCSRPSC